ncbi:MAG: DUF4352 domain-containing protein [Anaerolineae bacterium]|nr:DUF4352 domain-containing protein [Anaerolineae bacterium]
MPETHNAPLQAASSPGAGRRPLLIPGIVAVGIVICLVVVLIVTLALRPILFPGTETTGIPLEITLIPSTGPTPPPPADGQGSLIDVGDSLVALAIPSVLELGGSAFPIRPISGAAWSTTAPTAAEAIWLQGTVINYVIGLEASADNQAMVDQLANGDPIVLSLSNGGRLSFVIARRETVSASDTATILGQYAPGLTLVLSNEAEEQQVIFATLGEAEEPVPQAGDTAARPGQPVQAGDAMVTVEEGYTDIGSSQVPAGTLAYQVNFAVQNTGAESLDTAFFVMELVDGLGNRYLPSTAISSQGDYPVLAEEIAPGETVSATVGYLIPELMTGTQVTWVFGPLSSSELRAHFILDYAPPTERTRAWAEIYDVEAFLSNDLAVLHIVAEIENTGDMPLEVTTDNILLSSSAGESALQVAAPPLPWNIPGGESRIIELQFSTPAASTAVVTILGYTFEISGLP